MSLNNRNIKILKKILKVEEADLNELSNCFNFSIRTLRYDLENINYYLRKSDFGKIEKLGKGKFKFIGDQKKVEDYLQNIEKRVYSISSKERERIIALRLLLSEEKFKISETAEQLEVSRPTLKKDLNSLEKKFDDYGLKITYESNEFNVVGKENSIRKLLLKLIFETDYFSEQKNLIENDCQIYLKHEIDRIFGEVIEVSKEFINGLQSEFEEKISDEAYEIILINLMVMLKRIKKGKILKKIDENLDYKAYSEIVEIFKNVEKKLSLNICDFEIINFSSYFFRMYKNNANMLYSDWIKIEGFSNSLIRDLEKSLDIDLSDDKLLLNGLMFHLGAMLNRIRNFLKVRTQISIDHPELDKKFFITLKRIINKNSIFYFDHEVNDDEILLLQFHIQSAIDRKLEERSSVKNILLVCALGYGTSQLLAQKIVENYDVNVIDVIPYHCFDEYKKFEKLDLIISTIDLSIKGLSDKDFIQIKPIFDNVTYEKLEKLGLMPRKTNESQINPENIIKIVEKSCDILDHKTLFKDIHNLFLKDKDSKESYSLKEMLPKDNIALDVEAKNWKEAIIKSGEILVNENYVNKNYVEEMVKNVEVHGPYMIIAEKVILPHAKGDNDVHRTGMSLARLKSSVYFPNNEEVNIVICLASRDKKSHIQAIRQLTKMIDNFDFIKKINMVKTKDEMLEIVEKSEKLFCF